MYWKHYDATFVLWDNTDRKHWLSLHVPETATGRSITGLGADRQAYVMLPKSIEDIKTL